MQETRKIVLASLAVTGAIWAILTWQRAGVEPYGISVFRHLLLFQDYYMVLPFIVVLLAALVAPVRELGVRLALWCGGHVRAVAAFTVLLTAAGTRWVYHQQPLSMDEYAVLFQSQAFAAGELAGRMPPALLDWLVPAWMYEFFRVNPATGAVASAYWPGFSLLLAPFAALGIPWALNPLIAGATLIVMHRIALELFKGAESAGYAVLLTLASPVITINALTYNSTPARLLANALFMLLLLRPTPRRALAAGLVGSAALVLQNPVPHLLFALPWIGWLVLGRGPGLERPQRLKVLGALVAGYLPVSLALGLGWALFMYDFTADPAIASLPKATDVGALIAARAGGVVSWTSRTGAAAAHLASLYKVWLWAVPALAAAAALGAWRLRHDRGPWLVMALSAALTYFAYFLVRFDQGHGWGARYFHSAWLVLPLFAVAAIDSSLLKEKQSLAGYLAGCAVLSLALLTTFRALQVEQFMARHLAQLPTAAAGTARVLIIDPRGGYFNWDLAQNDPFARNEVLRLTSRGPQMDGAMMAREFPQYRLLGSDRRGAVWGLPPP